MTFSTLRRQLPLTVLTVLSILILLGGYFVFTKATGNFHEVAQGLVYRSGQLSAEQLGNKASEFGLKSVINLRGKPPKQKWYEAEIALCTSRGIQHFDVPSLSAGKDLSLEQMDALVSLLRDAPKPLLIHCKDGADRAALASALYHMAIEGKTLNEADNELTVWYGHIPFITPHVAAMGRSLHAYAANRPPPTPQP